MRAFILGMLLVSAPGIASAAQLSISSAASHSSGRYGAEKPTTVTSTSIGATGTFGEWEVSATLPYISVGVGGAELTVGGVVIQPEEGQGRISGFGDTFVAVGRTLPLGDEFPIDVAVQGQLKLPTGARRLSTGKLDGGIDVELSRQIGSVAPFLSVGHHFYGDSSELELENGWAVSAGATLTFGKVTLIGSYDWSQSPVGLTSAKEIFVVASGPFGNDWSWTIYGSKGLSEGAADKMVGFAITRRFGSSRIAAPVLQSRREAEAALDQR